MNTASPFSPLTKFRDLPTNYARLTALYPPRPIHNEAKLAAATAMIDALAGHDLTPDQDDYLDLVSSLVSSYEEQVRPVRVKHVTPVQALEMLLEETGMNASDLGRLLGSRDLGSKILRGQRALNLRHIAVLCEHFAVGPELFLAKAKHSRRRQSHSPGHWRIATQARAQ
jgi:HTH-type transcriptional regulator/antitoxin HigA